MPSYLLTWNPTRWHWDEADYRQTAATTARGELAALRWSCGNTKRIAPGDRLFLVRQGVDRGLIASGFAVSSSYADTHWDPERDDEALYVDSQCDTLVDYHNHLLTERLIAANLGIDWDHILASGVKVPDEAVPRLEAMWRRHLSRTGHVRPHFIAEQQYSRADVYRVLEIPTENQGGDWDTGSHKHNEDWYIFANVGTAGRTGHDYQNRWQGDELIWYGPTGSKKSHRSIQSMLKPVGDVFVFTRTNQRGSFTFNGSATAATVIDAIPVTIRWRFTNPFDRRHEVLPEEVVDGEPLREGAVRSITVNAYERNPEARRRCIEHYGNACVVCGFSFERIYGELGRDYIHVHHLRDLASIGQEYEVDPINDLRPVCPNCHAMLHREQPCLSSKRSAE